MLSVILLLWLVFAHLIGDFVFQNEYIAKEKKNSFYIMCCHCFLWTMGIAFVLLIFNTLEYWDGFFLFTGHLIIDECKLTNFNNKLTEKQSFAIDQILHFIQILIVLLF